MSGFTLTIRTGDPELDRRQVEHYRTQALAGGLSFHAEPLPGGGFTVRAEATASATLPSNLGEYRPSQMPPPLVTGAPGDSLPQPVMGTLPSRLGQARPAPAPAIHMATPGGICQLCGRSGPTRSVRFSQEVGVVVLRFHRETTGYLCKFCIDQSFIKMTGITLLFGWWGVISAFFSLLAIPRNLAAWLPSIGMATPAEDAASVASRRARGAIQISLGVLVSLVAAAFTVIGLVLVASEPAVDAGIEAAVIGLVLGALALAIMIVGIRGRMKATAIERRLNGALGSASG